jgi:hypothetical protein
MVNKNQFLDVERHCSVERFSETVYQGGEMVGHAGHNCVIKTAVVCNKNTKMKNETRGQFA